MIIIFASVAMLVIVCIVTICAWRLEPATRPLARPITQRATAASSALLLLRAA